MNKGYLVAGIMTVSWVFSQLTIHNLKNTISKYEQALEPMSYAVPEGTTNIQINAWGSGGSGSGYYLNTNIVVRPGAIIIAYTDGSIERHPPTSEQPVVAEGGNLKELNDTMNTLAEAAARNRELLQKMKDDRPKWEAWEADMDRRNREFWERDADIQRRFREMGITNTSNPAQEQP